MARNPQDIKKIAILVVLGLVIMVVWFNAFKYKPPRPPDTVLEEMPVEEPGFLTREQELPPPASAGLKIPRPSGSLEWGRDPFLIGTENIPPTVPGETVPTEEKKEDIFVLYGISWREGKALAIINGRIVKVGDYIKGEKLWYKVISITKDKVILRHGKEKIALKIREN